MSTRARQSKSRGGRTRAHALVLERSYAVEMLTLAAVSIYAFTIPLKGSIELYDAAGERVERTPTLLTGTEHVADKRSFRHFMLKEIHEQPRAVANTLQERVANGRLLDAAFGPRAAAV